MRKFKSFKRSLFVSVVCLLVTVSANIGKAEVHLDGSPARITFDAKGNLLVTDYFQGNVLTVSPVSLETISEISINGRPLGIAWAKDLIYVGNSTTGQVEVFNTAGQMQYLLGHGVYPINFPLDIAIGNGNVYVVDGNAKVVMVYSLDGTFITTIPQYGHDRNILANPTAIAVDTNHNQVFVSDYGDLGRDETINPRIQVFDLQGTLLYTIKSGEKNKYRFTMPQGLALNSKQQLFVTDSLTGEIHIFDANDGMLLGKVKGSGSKTGVFKMKMPLDLVIDDRTNDLFVTNNLMGNIQVFEKAGEIK